MGSTEEVDGSLIDNETPVTRSQHMPIRLDVSNSPFDLFAYAGESCFETTNV